MLKIHVFASSVILYFGQIVCASDILSLYLNNLDSSVTRVRTISEREQRWQEFAVLDFIGLVEQYNGYKAEEHTVLTTDGYLLKLHRVNASPMSPKAVGKPVVFIAPGILTSSDFYVMFGPNQSLVLQLADAGHDVWIGNFRGTTYSRRHIQYSTASDSYEFWDFSLDDLALVDLPLFIDTVLNVTNKNKLSYVGYSMGTTTAFMLLSTKPQYNDKIKVVTSIAPEVFFTPPFSRFIKLLIKLFPTITRFLYSRNIYEIVPQSRFNLIMAKNICTKPKGYTFCQFLFNMISNSNIDSDKFATVLDYMPAGSSFNIIVHYYQLMLSGALTHYNYGTILNKAIYGTISPPECDLAKVTSPQAIFYSENDVLSSEKDVHTLKSKLKNVILFHKVPTNFNHLDYFFNENTKHSVFNHVIDVINYFS